MNLESVTTVNNPSSAQQQNYVARTEVINSESTTTIHQPNSSQKQNKDIQAIVRIVLLLLTLTIISSFFVIVAPGQRGVLMRFGEVQPEILSEGLHPVIPIVNTVEKLSVRAQNQEISTEASSKDLQSVYMDVTLNWHISPEKVNIIFQRVGNRQAIVHRIINPAVKEVLKAVMAAYGVAAVTIATVGDDLSIYVPLFATSTGEELGVILTVFFSLVAVWCYAAYRFTQVPTLAKLFTCYGSYFVPFVLTGLGILRSCT